MEALLDFRRPHALPIGAVGIVGRKLVEAHRSVWLVVLLSSEIGVGRVGADSSGLERPVFANMSQSPRETPPVTCLAWSVARAPSGLCACECRRTIPVKSWLCYLVGVMKVISLA